MLEVSKTTQGHPVLAGLYRAHETNGIPLSMIVRRVIAEGAVPDWLAMVRECMDAGMGSERAFAKVKDAAQDGWPECAAQVCAMLDWCAENGRV